MAEQFRVTLAWLDQLVGRLNGAADAADTALKALKETGPIRTGRKSLDNACYNFQDEWKTAVKSLRKEVGVIAKGVGEARARYGATEQAVIDALPKVPQAAPAAPGSITEVLG